ncbi:unnamed protein product [Anisakis simplex]|uniref:Annexin n=1 Tax=Anisakis simplex TaxID=6269 RepID=A0A0M3KDL1_ANISI|nr:unnamed protein product [Anisakis simplex]
MKGFGCDKEKVAAEYMGMYGSDLRHDLKKELHGDFEEVIMALTLSPAVYDARHLHKAISVRYLHKAMHLVTHKLRCMKII